jgi:ABC-type oligopeptide transport system, periplasmic component
MKKLSAVLLCLCILFSFSSCEKKEPSNANKSISFQLEAEPKTLDPQIAVDSSSIIAVEALFEGLVRLDADQKPYPGVAEKWESNADSTVFTFTLRSDAKWSDEKHTPVTADDFVFAFQRALLPATDSKMNAAMFCIKNAKEVSSGKLSADKLGVTAKDAHTLVIQLNYSYADFPALTASTAFMPCNRNFFESTGGRYGLERSYVIGNGPFVIDGKYGWDHGKNLNLARSSSYSGYRKPLPASVKFTITNKDNVIPDPVTALKNGTVDAIAIPAGETSAATAAGCTLTSFEDTTWGLCFNTQSQTMKSKNIRKAFIQSIDRASALKHLPEDVKAAESIIPPSTTLQGKAYSTLVSGPFYLKQDKNSAALLTAGLNELSLPELKSLSVLCPDDPNVKLMLNDMIAVWNSQFHNYFNIEPMDTDALAASVQSGGYEVALCPIRAGSGGPLAVLSLFKSGEPGNPAKLADAAFDSLLADAQKKSGGAAVPACAAAEKYLNDQGVFYPLYYEKHYFAAAKGVTGIVFHPYGAGIDFIQAGKE